MNICLEAKYVEWCPDIRNVFLSIPSSRKCYHFVNLCIHSNLLYRSHVLSTNLYYKTIYFRSLWRLFHIFWTCIEKNICLKRPHFISLNLSPKTGFIVRTEMRHWLIILRWHTFLVIELTSTIRLLLDVKFWFVLGYRAILRTVGLTCNTSIQQYNNYDSIRENKRTHKVYNHLFMKNNPNRLKQMRKYLRAIWRLFGRIWTHVVVNTIHRYYNWNCTRIHGRIHIFNTEYFMNEILKSLLVNGMSNFSSDTI